MSTHEDYAPDSSGWSASLYNKVAPFVYSSSSTAAVLALLAAQPGERIIDFGCGSGEVTLEIEKVVSGTASGIVVGVDSSQSMVDKASSIGLKHAFVADIQALTREDTLAQLVGTAPNDPGFDAIFSNAALHWCKRSPQGVIESARQLLKPGGRFVAEMGGFLNCVGVRSALYVVLKNRGYDPVIMDPWFFPSVEEYSSLLRAAGFQVTHISLNPRFTPLPEGLHAWLRLFARNSFLSSLNDTEADEVLAEVTSMCAVDCQDSQGGWALMYMRLRFCTILQS
ncbi:hypothetical protein HGRIS_005874 [Hohenbuehelia grisea]|uniref:S-adenosyl-L-methionine-dependent methyltransferase n=1 Tax=Hohenbuehelia grisea TaxID=104357 RepID=A0ABR3JY40_9AGAR